MKFGNIDSRVGKTICSFVLVGTLMTCILALPKDDSVTFGREIASGHYTDEDVKKNRQIVMNRINRVSGSEAKTLGKVKHNLVPTKLSK